MFAEALFESSGSRSGRHRIVVQVGLVSSAEWTSMLTESLRDLYSVVVVTGQEAKKTEISTDMWLCSYLSNLDIISLEQILDIYSNHNILFSQRLCGANLRLWIEYYYLSILCQWTSGWSNVCPMIAISWFLLAYYEHLTNCPPNGPSLVNRKSSDIHLDELAVNWRRNGTTASIRWHLDER